VTVTTEISKNSATTLSRMNFCGYVGRVTISSLVLNVSALFSNRVRIRVRVRIRFSVWLVSGHAHVFIALSIVIVTRLRSGELTSSSSDMSTWFNALCCAGDKGLNLVVKCDAPEAMADKVESATDLHNDTDSTDDKVTEQFFLPFLLSRLV